MNNSDWDNLWGVITKSHKIWFYWYWVRFRFGLDGKRHCHNVQAPGFGINHNVVRHEEEDWLRRQWK